MTRMEVIELICVESVVRMYPVICYYYGRKPVRKVTVFCDFRPGKLREGGLIPGEVGRGQGERRDKGSRQKKISANGLSVQYPQNWSMSSSISPGDLQARFKQALFMFYRQVSAKHLPPSTVQQKITKLLQLSTYNFVPALRARSSNKDLQKTLGASRSDPAFLKLKITVNGDHLLPTLDTSRSKSSQQLSLSVITGCSKDFSTDWIYASTDPNRVITFAFLSAFIIKDQPFGFEKLYGQICEHLKERMGVVPEWARSAEYEWGLIRSKMTRSSGAKWQKGLRKYVDGLTDLFTNLVAMFVASPVEPGRAFGSHAAKRLAFSTGLSVTYFQIDFKQIRKLERVAGRQGLEIVVGYLSHCGMHVMASQAPTYSKQEQSFQGLRQALKNCADETLQTIQGNQQRYELQQFCTLANQKQNFVRGYIGRKLSHWNIGE